MSLPDKHLLTLQHKCTAFEINIRLGSIPPRRLTLAHGSVIFQFLHRRNLLFQNKNVYQYSLTTEVIAIFVFLRPLLAFREIWLPWQRS